MAAIDAHEVISIDVSDATPVRNDGGTHASADLTITKRNDGGVEFTDESGVKRYAYGQHIVALFNAIHAIGEDGS